MSETLELTLWDKFPEPGEKAWGELGQSGPRQRVKQWEVNNGYATFYNILFEPVAFFQDWLLSCMRDDGVAYSAFLSTTDVSNDWTRTVWVPGYPVGVLDQVEVATTRYPPYSVVGTYGLYTGELQDAEKLKKFFALYGLFIKRKVWEPGCIIT